MFMQDSKEIVETIKALHGEVRHLRQLIHLQQAILEAVRIYAVAKIADLSGRDRESAFEDFAKIIRTAYDEHISKIEKHSPAIAADIDVRSEMSAEDQATWYLASEDFPKPDESESDERDNQK